MFSASPRLLDNIRNGSELSMRDRIKLTIQLSAPAIVAQVSSIAMQFIDASMVGHLGANASASIGLIMTTTWLLWGLLTSMGTGFSVQIAHHVGGNNHEHARSVVRQSLIVCTIYSVIIATIGCALSGVLPVWLGGEESIREGATVYFFIFCLSIPALQLEFLAGAILRCSGNMNVPSILNVLMCVMDVVFNFLLIFPTREISVLGIEFMMPGAGLGIVGAALGTALAEVITAILMLWFLCCRSRELAIRRIKGSWRVTKQCIRKALVIGVPIGCERVVLSGAQILITVIVAPLGINSIAANAFAITAESLCYMPGYGIAEAATTLIGQSIGAGRRALTKSFAWITVGMGMSVMTVMGILMYIFAPFLMEIMTSFEEIQTLGVMALRTEAWAEPMFAASIVAYGVFVGAGKTIVPSVMNLGSMWGVRLTLAAWLAPILGLHGVWIAMCIELCFRGTIFLLRMRFGNWMPQTLSPSTILIKQ
ncbi:MAG: MATE family efflux transporter [Paramuribaculum sp.]|nr:MATE family efflux transporter [Paramuribaculum sp.]